MSQTLNVPNKTITDSVQRLKWLKTSHRGPSFQETPIGAARGLRKANTLAIKIAQITGEPRSAATQ